jgi:NAD(P)H dehydrogenase (quinone)
MPKVLVLFHSRTGRTAALAEAIAEGAGSVKFTEVELRRIEDITTPARAGTSAPASRHRALESVDSIADYDAVIAGSPSWYGGMSAELKHVLDQLGPLSGGRALVDKVGSAFSTASAAQGGAETTVQSILVAMMHQGMLIVPPVYGEDPAAARSHGARVAKVAEWVRHAKSHEHRH